MPEIKTPAAKAVEVFVNNVHREFANRAIVEPRRKGKDFGISLDITQEGNTLWLTFTKDIEVHTITIPVPYMENGVVLIEQNKVVRAVSPYYIRQSNAKLGFMSVMEMVTMNDPRGIITPGLIKKINFIQQIIYGFINGNASMVIHNLQKAINEVVARMPLHETFMNSYIMNHRLIIVDPEFDAIVDPAIQLEYQVDKNREFFNRGWTSMGMSEGTLAHNNYMLTMDLRPFTPYGIRHHNPQRNLYSTLGMKGDETPLVRTEAMKDLEDKGIKRTGWNFNTLFVDTPYVFEDQILVDKSHVDKYVERIKRIQCFGELLVQPKQKLVKGQALTVNVKGEEKRFNLIADSAWVDDIVEGEVNVGGVKTKVWNITVKYRRNFKEGMKLNNLHANKGVIRIKDLGYAKDPRTGELVKIDVIVSSRAVMKRKNYGQILEAITNNITGNTPVVIPDNCCLDINSLKQRLVKEGFNENGTWECNTFGGELYGVFGKVFWGVTKDVEDAIWEPGDTTRINGRELRTAGMKFSSIELSALEVILGKNNPVTDEIMSYTQGADDVQEMLKIAKSKMGEVPANNTIVKIHEINYVNQDNSIIVDEESIKGTIVDEEFHRNGFILHLPLRYQVNITKNGDVIEGLPTQNLSVGEDISKVYIFDKIYIPKGILRRCWNHENGKVGLNDIGTTLNNLIIIGHRYINNPEESLHISMLYRAVGNYFRLIADKLGGKRGDISTYGMCVRYPNSIKGVATLTNNLKANTIEIHRDSAKQIGTYNGDVVLVIRFPVLGFTCVRPQMVKVTDDPQARYTIRVQGNSLCSAGLDFDGDNIYVTAFKSKEARMALLNEWLNPKKVYYDFIEELNAKMGVPHTQCMTMDEYGITAFRPVDVDWHCDIVRSCTGVKSHTGPVIALTYNLMRILENSHVDNDMEIKAAIHVFMDKVANSIFKQKHVGVKPLHETVVDALCSGNVNTLVENGFREDTSTMIIDIIKQKAIGIGISNLAEYHKKAKENGWSNVINKLVRMQNKLYFASRAKLDLCILMEHIEEGVDKLIDIPSRTFKWAMYDKILINRSRQADRVFGLITKRT